MTEFFNTGLTQQQFLDEYWQKKPLLIRQAFTHFGVDFSADELAGLACEEDIESRLIEEQGKSGPWQLRHGPFSEADFAGLPDSHWTLLVQDVDKHVPELAELFEPFRFLPDWRRDDLMVSYAPIGGSVGPHTDGYDVFLLQAMGTRRWQISDSPLKNPQFIDELSLKILAEFEADHCWDLQAGDMLYLPPQFAHHGVAQNECMTFSIGFRAPSQIELMDAFMLTMSEHNSGEYRYADAGAAVARHEFELDQAALLRFKRFLIDTIETNDDLLAETLGRLLTETKPSLEALADSVFSDVESQQEIEQRFAEGDSLLRNRYQRFVWSANEQEAMLFVAGEKYVVPVSVEPYLTMLCDSRPINHQEWLKLCQQPELIMLVKELIANGHWYWKSEMNDGF